MMGWKDLGSIIGTVGGALGAWSLLRSLWRERSNLIVTQKHDAGWHKIDQNGPLDPATVTVTMLISNTSSRPNAVIRYEAEIALKSGGTKKLRVEQGKFSEHNSSDTVDLYHFGVTPLNIPPFGTVEATLCFLHVELEQYKFPLSFEITAFDMYGKQFAGRAEVSS